MLTLSAALAEYHEALAQYNTARDRRERAELALVELTGANCDIPGLVVSGERCLRIEVMNGRPLVRMDPGAIIFADETPSG